MDARFANWLEGPAGRRTSQKLNHGLHGLHGCEAFWAQLQAHIEPVDFIYATLVETNLCGVKYVINVNFTGATLVSINLSGLDLTTANFCRVRRLDAVDFTGSDLSGAVWTTCERCQPGSIGMCILQER